MNDLYAFLNPVVTVPEKEIAISDRFLDENGNPVKWKIHALTQKENEEISRLARSYDKDGNRVFDPYKYNNNVVLACVSFPPLRNEELVKKYGNGNPENVACNMLLADEFNRLLNEINQLGDMQKKAADKEAKN